MSGRLVPLRRVNATVAELSDEAVLAACATGDPVALGTLFDRYHLAVYRFAVRLPTCDEAACDDLVQATFLEVAKAASNFRGDSSVKTWILGLAANLARRQLRGERRRRVHQAQFVERLRAMAPPATPDESLGRRQRLERIADAIAALPHDQQIAFVMCDLEQLPGGDVARVLNIPEGTLWRRLHDARKAVRVAYEARAEGV
jgi:RNA polymerase sigma-70 factor (ECF subfamily)